MVKPFSPKELMLRIKVVIERHQNTIPDKEHEIFRKEGLEVDFTGRTVSVDGKRVELSPKEYEWNDYTNEGSAEGNLGFICEWDNSNPTILTAVKSNMTVKAGKTAKLKYQIYPVKKKVTFKSSNKKVATVSKKGVITGKKAGKATITISSGSKKVKVKVTVKK